MKKEKAIKIFNYHIEMWKGLDLLAHNEFAEKSLKLACILLEKEFDSESEARQVTTEGSDDE